MKIEPDAKVKQLPFCLVPGHESDLIAKKAKKMNTRKDRTGGAYIARGVQARNNFYTEKKNH